MTIYTTGHGTGYFNKNKIYRFRITFKFVSAKINNNPHIWGYCLPNKRQNLREKNGIS